jgi:hypothetical protein
MDPKVNTQRMDKRSSKKDRSDGPYSAKHIRHLEQMMSLSSTRNAVNKTGLVAESKPVESKAAEKKK